MDLTILETAGLTQPEFAQIVGVRRNEVASWADAPPAPRHAARIAHALELIQLTIDSGGFPGELANTNHRGERKSIIRIAMRGARGALREQ